MKNVYVNILCFFCSFSYRGKVIIKGASNIIGIGTLDATDLFYIFYIHVILKQDKFIIPSQFLVKNPK